MSISDSMREAARRADIAVERAMQKYRHGHVTDEDDLTGVLVGNLDAELDGQIGDLSWSTSIVRHRAGVAAEESRIGADIIVHVSLDTSKQKYSKGTLVQAKRVERDVAMNKNGHNELVDQCEKMLKITPAAFVFNYTTRGMRCGPASRIAGTTSRFLFDECIWTPYRFFLELFRCPIGDPRFTSARVRDLPVPVLVEIMAFGD